MQILCKNHGSVDRTYPFIYRNKVLSIQMHVYKLQGDFSLLFFVFLKLFLIMVLGTMCLYTSSRAIVVDHSLCS